MTETIDLGAHLTEHWTEHKEACEQGVRQAEANLARIALIYSGQLPLSLLEDDIQDGKR